MSGPHPTGPPGSVLGAGDLVLAAATLSADGATPLAVAIEAARAGGFRGISLWASTYLAERAVGAGSADIRRKVDDAGLVVDHVEAVIGWAGPGDPGAPYAEEASRTQVLDAARALGAGFVSVLLFGARGATEDAAAEAFAGIAADVGARGLGVALEFAPGTPVRDVAAAARVTGPVPNGGVLYDTWHAHFGPSTLDDLDELPGDRILAVQVNDGPAERGADHAWATRHHRAMPGAGGFRLAGTLDALRAAGCRAPLTVEVFDDELVASLGPVLFARRLGQALRAIGTTAGIGTTAAIGGDAG